jgi:putative SbcD/Mre11-related phosphoesterase
MAVEPVPGAPAAVADVGGECALVVADYHAGIEAGLRREGVEIPTRAADRREALSGLVAEHSPDRLIVLGDLGNAIGDPTRTEREEVRELFAALPEAVAVTVARGNHDGDLAATVEGIDRSVELAPAHGTRIGDVGFAHGHTWPSPAVLEADVICVGHEHPAVRLEDAVGGRRVERVWLRGGVDPEPFERFHDRQLGADGDLIVFPAFNDLSGGTWVNVEGQSFLAPFLPDGLAGGEAYLLDGTRLGDYRTV